MKRFPQVIGLAEACSVAFIRITRLSCAALLFLLMAVAQPAYADRPEDIDARKAAEIIKKNGGDILILDVRTPAEYAQGHLAKAENMDFFGGKFDLDARELPKDKTILVYCRSGIRSAGAVEALQQFGYTRLLHMSDGITGWQKAGLPLEK